MINTKKIVAVALAIILVTHLVVAPLPAVILGIAAWKVYTAGGALLVGSGATAYMSGDPSGAKLVWELNTGNVLKIDYDIDLDCDQGESDYDDYVQIYAHEVFSALGKTAGQRTDELITIDCESKYKISVYGPLIDYCLQQKKTTSDLKEDERKTIDFPGCVTVVLNSIDHLTLQLDDDIQLEDGFSVTIEPAVLVALLDEKGVPGATPLVAGTPSVPGVTPAVPGVPSDLFSIEIKQAEKTINPETGTLNRDTFFLTIDNIPATKDSKDPIFAINLQQKEFKSIISNGVAATNLTSNLTTLPNTVTNSATALTLDSRLGKYFQIKTDYKDCQFKPAIKTYLCKLQIDAASITDDEVELIVASNWNPKTQNVIDTSEFRLIKLKFAAADTPVKVAVAQGTKEVCAIGKRTGQACSLPAREEFKLVFRDAIIGKKIFVDAEKETTTILDKARVHPGRKISDISAKELSKKENIGKLTLNSTSNDYNVFSDPAQCSDSLVTGSTYSCELVVTEVVHEGKPITIGNLPDKVRKLQLVVFSDIEPEDGIVQEEEIMKFDVALPESSLKDCETPIECLARIDKRFVDSLFGGAGK